MNPDLPDYPENQFVVMLEELGHPFPRQLSDEFAANKAGTPERLEALSLHGSSEILEDGVADAGERPSAAIMRAAFDSLDDGSASVMHYGKTYQREVVSRKRVMTSLGAIEYERTRYRRRGRPSLFPAPGRAVGCTQVEALPAGLGKGRTATGDTACDTDAVLGMN